MPECIKCQEPVGTDDLYCSVCWRMPNDPAVISRLRQQRKARMKKQACPLCGEPFKVNRHGDGYCPCGQEGEKEEMANEIVKTGGQFSLAPTTFEEALRFADLLAKSDFVPKDFKDKPGNILAAMQMGAELGLQPLQAIQNIAVINGRPTVFGDAALAIVTGSPAFEGIEETDDGTTATCVLKRKGRPAVTRKFSMDDAKKAGLLSKSGPWQSYPARMRQMRARSFAMRDLFPDILKGVVTREEAQDIEVEVIRSEPVKPAPVQAQPLDAEIVDDNVQGPVTAALPVIIKEGPVAGTEEFFLEMMREAATLEELSSVGIAIKEAGLKTKPLIDAYLAKQAELKRK